MSSSFVGSLDLVQNGNRSKLISQFKCNVKFLSLLSNTQLFMEYFEQAKDPNSIAESDEKAALLIADWLFFRWKRFSKVKTL